MFQHNFDGAGEALRNRSPNQRRGHALRRRTAVRSAVWAIAGAAAAAVVVPLLTATRAQADVSFGDFETGTLPASWGALTNSGIKPWSDPAAGPSPANGTVIVAANAGTLTGSHVLELTGQESFNFGQASGGALGYDFLADNLRQSFFDNDQIEFDWYPVPNNSPSGYSQAYNIILNSQGGGFTNVDGFSAGNQNLNQYYYTGYNGILHHVVVNYAAYKAAILASGNPDGGGWLQFGIQPNAGGGAPADWYLDNFKLTLAPNVWNVDSDGNWSTDGNWSPAAPNAVNKVASFDSIITANRTITVDAPQTIGQLKFNNSNSYTIIGISTLTMDSTSAGVAITVAAGSHVISAPLIMSKDATVTVAPAASSLTLSNLQSSTAALSKTGDGSLLVNNVRAGNLTVNGGLLQVLPNATAAGVSKINGLTIASGAKLDLSNNHLITSSAAGTWNGSAYTGVTGLVKSGKGATNTWNGTTGIITSQAAAQGTNFTTIGVAKASDVRPATATATAIWAGQTITGTDTLVMYTYGGDATLDGKINVDDYIRIDSGIAAGLTGWSNGDFNYDGKINIDDYTQFIDTNIGTQGAAFFTGGGIAGGGGAAGVTAIPEPATLSLLGLAALATLRRGRHRRRRD